MSVTTLDTAPRSTLQYEQISRPRTTFQAEFGKQYTYEIELSFRSDSWTYLNGTIKGVHHVDCATSLSDA